MFQRILHIKQTTILVILCGAAIVAATAAYVADGRTQCITTALDAQYSGMAMGRTTLTLALEHAATEHTLELIAARALSSSTAKTKLIAAANTAYAMAQNSAHDTYLKARRQVELQFQADRVACVKNSPAF